MKTFTKRCAELNNNGGILKDELGTHYFKPGYIAHRVDGPAREWTYGPKVWCYEGKWIMDTKGDVTPEQLLEFKLMIL